MYIRNTHFTHFQRDEDVQYMKAFLQTDLGDANLIQQVRNLIED